MAVSQRVTLWRARNPRSPHSSRSMILAVSVVLALVAALLAAVTVGTAHAAGTLLSQGKTATASSVNAGNAAANAVDGNTGTRWESAWSDPQWLQVDLGGAATVSQVVIQWETASAKAYQIQTSNDGANWTSIYSTTTGPGGTQTLNIAGSGRYVRMYGTQRNTGYGYSMWEFQVYGTMGSGGGGSTCGTQNAALDQPTTASSSENAGTAASAATDGNTGTRWSSAFSDPQWLEVDLGSTVTVCQVAISWETAYATSFQIQTSNDGSNWASVYSTTTGAGGNQTLNVSGTGRYVRVYGTARATGYGYSIWEFQVFTGGTGGGGSPSPSPSASASPTPSPSSTGGGNGNCGTTNAALGHPATASSIQDSNPAYDPFYAFDGSTMTRWSSAAADPQWIEVDLGGSLPICQVTLSWENAYASGFQIQTSNDGANWASVYSTTTGTGGNQTLNVSGSGRYVRMYETARATGYGDSLWEFAVYTVGNQTVTIPPPQPQPAPGNCPWLNEPNVAVSTRVAQLMAAMTQDQKAGMLHGDGSSTYIGQIAGQPALCIPPVNLEDGPTGVGDGLGGVTQFPDGEVSAATFDTSYEHSYGVAVGQEFAGKGVNVSLGPTINMVRDPRWGRAYETFGEDPYLTGEIVSADVQGMQSQGVMAMVKHAAAYNIEQPSAPGNEIVDTRTLQEIYLPGFQTAIEKGGAASIMCGYSMVNGNYSCQNSAIENIPMYQQAGFQGFISSDWGGIHTTVDSANAGETIEMPFGGFFGSALEQAVANGQVTQATFDTMVSRVLTQMFRFGMFDKAPTGSTTAIVAAPSHLAVALQGDEEGTVLLKNNGVLPLNPNGSESIAVIGTDASNGAITDGAGSGGATSAGTYLPLYSIQQRTAGTHVTVNYNDGSNQASAVAAAQAANVAIVFAADTNGHEESDNTSLNLPNSQDALVSAVAQANPNTIVVLNDNSAILMPWLNQVAGVFEGF